MSLLASSAEWLAAEYFRMSLACSLASCGISKTTTHALSVCTALLPFWYLSQKQGSCCAAHNVCAQSSKPSLLGDAAGFHRLFSTLMGFAVLLQGVDGLRPGRCIFARHVNSTSSTGLINSGAMSKVGLHGYWATLRQVFGTHKNAAAGTPSEISSGAQCLRITHWSLSWTSATSPTAHFQTILAICFCVTLNVLLLSGGTLSLRMFPARFREANVLWWMHFSLVVR